MATQYDFNPYSNPQRESSSTRSSFNPFLSGPVPGVQSGVREGALPGDMALRALLSMMPTAGARPSPTALAATPPGLTQAGPITWGTSPVTGTPIARQITGGFAPGTIGATFESMLPQILASLTSGGGALGGPSREDLLNPRLADIDRAFRESEQALLNRYAALGRDITGSVPTEALMESGARRGLERQRTFGDVDTLLAQLGIQQQGAAVSRLAAIAQIMAALGMVGR